MELGQCELPIAAGVAGCDDLEQQVVRQCIQGRYGVLHVSSVGPRGGSLSAHDYGAAFAEARHGVLHYRVLHCDAH
eukprot:scaffold24568_cov70-Phaeocystis_antarctica.AAC.3